MSPQSSLPSTEIDLRLCFPVVAAWPQSWHDASLWLPTSSDPCPLVYAQTALSANPKTPCTDLQVDQAMPRDVARGLSSVKRFVREHQIRGVHGTLIELFKCMPQLYTAVEVHPSLPVASLVKRMHYS